MSLEAWFTVLVIIGTLWALVRQWLAPSLAVTGAMVLLLVTGIVTPAEALAGFSNPAPITVAALFILARAVEKTGALQPFVSGTLSNGNGHRTTLARLLLPTAGASAFLNNTPIVAMLAPQVAGWAEQHGRPVSWYLIPISFAAILGGMITLIGTSTNLVVSGLLEDAGHAPMGMFEMTGVGLPVAVLGIGLIVLLAPRLLPDRRGPMASFQESLREFTLEMEVEPDGAMDGRTVEEAGLRHLDGVFLARLERGERIIAPVAPEEILAGADRLGFVGRADQAVSLQTMRGLRSAEQKHVDRFRDGAHGFYEAVISSTSSLVGETLRSADFRGRFQAAVLAIHRAGERVDAKLGDVELQSGDTLLLLSKRGFRGQWKDSGEFLVVSELDGTMPVRTGRAFLVLGIAAAVVLLAGLGVISILKAALLASIAIVVTGTLTPNEAARAVDLKVVLLIAAAFGVGNAVEASGLAAVIAGGLVGNPALGPVVVLAGVVLCTIVLTELVTNNAAAVLMFPVAVAAASSIGADPRPFAWAVALAGSASFLTPIGYQTNTMIYGLGGYRFTDYARLGLPVALSAAGLIVTLVSLSWDLT